MARFKKGDRVRLTKDWCGAHRHTVVILTEDSIAPWASLPGGGERLCVPETSLEVVELPQPGDLVEVLPRMEGWEKQYPCYTSPMASCAGKQYLVDRVANSENCVVLRDTGISWAPDWHMDWLRIIKRATDKTEDEHLQMWRQPLMLSDMCFNQRILNAALSDRLYQEQAAGASSGIQTTKQHDVQGTDQQKPGPTPAGRVGRRGTGRRIATGSRHRGNPAGAAVGKQGSRKGHVQPSVGHRRDSGC